jgi:hypothetical protein
MLALVHSVSAQVVFGLGYAVGMGIGALVGGRRWALLVPSAIALVGVGLVVAEPGRSDGSIWRALLVAWALSAGLLAWTYRRAAAP